MKPMDYTVGGTVTEPTFTLLTDRAKQRTPGTIAFKGRTSALEFMKAAEAEGYRFSGAELIDTQRKLVKYGYFAKMPNGQLVQCGQDWGPRDTVFEPGDSLGIKNGKEGIIVSVVTGQGRRAVRGRRDDRAGAARCHLNFRSLRNWNWSTIAFRQSAWWRQSSAFGTTLRPNRKKTSGPRLV